MEHLAAVLSLRLSVRRSGPAWAIMPLGASDLARPDLPAARPRWLTPPLSFVCISLANHRRSSSRSCWTRYPRESSRCGEAHASGWQLLAVCCRLCGRRWAQVTYPCRCPPSNVLPPCCRTALPQHNV